jgi:hypothetical protein
LERENLFVAVQHVFDLYAGAHDTQDAVATVDDLTFAGNENVIGIRRAQEDALRLARSAGKSEEL